MHVIIAKPLRWERCLLRLGIGKSPVGLELNEPSKEASEMQVEQPAKVGRTLQTVGRVCILFWGQWKAMLDFRQGRHMIWFTFF